MTHHIGTETHDAGLEQMWLANAAMTREIVDLRTLLTTAERLASRTAIMMREADHRIKNSLQIVSSLMILKARRHDDAPARDALLSASNQIQSIGRIHDALQKDGGADEVDLGEMLTTMCGALREMAADPCRIEVVISAERIMTPVSLAQPLMLAVNEMVVNALRHACPDGRAGMVRIQATALDRELCVIVADDGVGLPPDYAKGRGYGMKLVRAMVEQICGELYAQSRNGASFTIFAPIPQSLQISECGQERRAGC